MKEITDKSVGALNSNKVIDGTSAQHLQRLMWHCSQIYAHSHYIQVRPHQYRQVPKSRPYAVDVYFEAQTIATNHKRPAHTLNKLDNYLRQQVHAERYIRSANHAVVLCRDKATARQILAAITGYASANTLRIASGQIRPIDRGVSYAGYIVFPSHLRLGVMLKQSLHQMARAYRAEQVDFDGFKREVAAWLELARIADPDDYYVHKVLGELWDRLALGAIWF